MSWRTILGLILMSVLGVLVYSYYKLRTFSDNIYEQLAHAGVRSVSIVTLVRPEDMADPEHYWAEQSSSFSEQLIEGVSGLPIKVEVVYWVPFALSNAEKQFFSPANASIHEQTRVMKSLTSDGFPSWLTNYPNSAITYNLLRIWALDHQSDLTFYLDPRTVNLSNKNPNSLLNTITVSVRGIGLTHKIFQYLLIPQKNESANGVLFINKQLILSSQDHPQPEELKRLMLSRLEYTKPIIEKIFQRSAALSKSSFESYLAILKERCELYLKKASLPIQESAMLNWVCGNTALHEYRMDYNFGDLYSQIVPQHDKKISKSDESFWNVNLLRESLGPDADLNSLLLVLLIQQDLQYVNESTSNELLNALQSYRQELENNLPESQQKILKEFTARLFHAEPIT